MKKKKGRLKRKAGRPSIYKKVLCKRIIEYFDQEPYEDVKIPHYKDGELVWEDIKRMPRPLPTLRGFARQEKIHYQRIYEWVNKNNPKFKKEFADAFTCAKNIQKDILIQNGLQGLYSPAFAIFTAKNITDMKDVQKIEKEVKESKDLTITVSVNEFEDRRLTLENELERLGIRTKPVERLEG